MSLTSFYSFTKNTALFENIWEELNFNVQSIKANSGFFLNILCFFIFDLLKRYWTHAHCFNAFFRNMVLLFGIYYLYTLFAQLQFS
jgi:hypothetical protein